ncbi:phospholipase D family protein [Lactobacillus sp. ESL0791]|uniref:phospholipase D family protein n=1 Tax=Lactobacillus sp. ESL0791 TaxID=2983234 RepID=UPI0023F65DFC|nr:phospholipase D family protein [Lactobacillus sp. ESL0791]MDF7638295.1 phospholipase D family protein [Lactobacillus sp. ESL0791]
MTEIKTTNVLYENQPVTWSIRQIFDKEKYDTLVGVTYSVSPKFVNQYLESFKQVTLVVGIPEGSIQAATNEELIKATVKYANKQTVKKESLKFFGNLRAPVKQEILDRKFVMKVPQPGYSIHSKFYLLENSQTGQTRVIVGSANLSNQAFDNNFNQFEEVLLYDNSPLYEVMEKHYKQDLAPILTDYLPQELFKIVKKKKKDLQDLQPEDQLVSATIFDDQDVTQIQQAEVAATVDNLKNGVSLGILPENTGEVVNQIQDEKSPTSSEYQRKHEDQNAEKLSYELASDFVTSRNNKHLIAAQPTVKKRVVKRLQVKRIEKVADTVAERPSLVFDESTIDLLAKKSGLFVQDTVNKKKLIPFGKYATTEQIRRSLATINHLLKNYEQFTIKYDSDYGARVYEAILYAFTAPFISVIRHHAGSEEEQKDVPQFLFIGGTANSGKSSLLRIISRMTAIHQNVTDFMDYSTILPEGTHNKKSQTVQQLSNWLQESNVYPLLVDEIPGEFFSKSSYGENLVVNTTNTVDSQQENYPAFIGTTNSDGYTLPERARRRSYYLKNDKVFDDKYKQESVIAYNQILAEIDNTLFKDFVLRFADRIEDENQQWEYYENGGKIDFLHITRDIFASYYEMVDEALPIFFPEHRYDDSQESSQEKWRKLYLGSSNEYFKYNKETDTLIFKISTLDENTSRFGDNRPSKVYRDALSPKVVNGNPEGVDVELDAPAFFEWINVKNPYISRNPFKKFFGNSK